MLDGLNWSKADGASDSAIERLQAAAPIELPVELLNLLRYTNGGEGPISIQPLWGILYPADEIVEIEIGRDFKEFFHEFFVIGGSGGGDAIALDLRSHPDLHVVSFDMTNIDLKESVCPIAPNFKAFLTLVGRDDQVS